VILPLASGFTSRQRRENLKIQDLLKSKIKDSKKVITTSQSNMHCNKTTKYHLNHSVTVKIQSDREIRRQERKMTSIKQNFIKSDTSNQSRICYIKITKKFFYINHSNLQNVF
jgi:hypothetical protein